MLIIVYSETDAYSISGNLGVSEYSYYFVLQKYLPILESMGTVISVREPAREVDPLYNEARARGENAVFMSFSPPHRTEPDLKCPTICVLAWEFSSIPDETWNEDPRNNWVETLAKIGNAIAISQYSVDVILGQMVAAPNIAAIPAPVTRKPPPCTRGKRHGGSAFGGSRSLTVSADVIDSSDLDISDDIVCFKGGLGSQSVLPLWDRKILELVFDAYTRENNGYRFLVGFHSPEHWGAWSRTDRPWISLPVMLQGDFTLELLLVGFEPNNQKNINVTIGGQSRSITINTDLTLYTLDFANVHDGSTIRFSGLETGYTLGSELLRALSLGLAKLKISGLDQTQGAQLSADYSTEGASQVRGGSDDLKTVVELKLNGLVYTSVFNPEDGRKNWEDIVTAFCWAFRDDPGKTLLLKFTCPSMASSWGRLFLLFSQLHPFACRVVVIHGYLTSDEMHELMVVTDFFVNASKAEGQCLPLLEFMAEGVPAIAPQHTAMASYINSDNALIIDSSLMVTCWPQDPREYDRTFFYRINWESLYENYVRSAKMDHAVYEEMSFQAASLVRRQFSVSAVSELLSKYLQRFDIK